MQKQYKPEEELHDGSGSNHKSFHGLIVIDHLLFDRSDLLREQRESIMVEAIILTVIYDL